MSEFAGVHHCTDNPNRLNDMTKASVVKPGQDQTKLRLPTGAAVVSRDDPLSSVRVERGVEMSLTGEQSVESVSELDMTSVVHPEAAPAPAGPLHEDASLSYQVGVQQPTSENNVGVQPTIKKVANVPARKVPRRVANQPQQIPRADVTEETRLTVNAPVQQQQAPRQPDVQPPPDPVFGVERIRVTLQSDKMGTHRIKVNKLAISDTIIMLGYIDDDDAVIVEPPITTEEGDFITVKQGSDTYKCRYYGFTAEMTVDTYPMLLVVLVRLEE